MVDIAISIVTKILEYVVEPILIRPLRPILSFKTIVDDFYRERDNLREKREMVKDAVQEAKKNVLNIYERVHKWLGEANSVLEDAKILQEQLEKTSCFNSNTQKTSCFNSNTRCDLSKQLTKNTESAKKLSEIAGSLYPVGIAADLRQQFSQDFMPTKSADIAFSQIMEALIKEDINMIGMYGMGGIGKTALAKQVVNEAQRLNIVARVILVNVSQTPQVKRIQDTIADFLDLKFTKISEEGRAGQLRRRLEAEKILVILDDVWKWFDLEYAGIIGCKVLLTTRLRRVCISMKCQINISLDIFSVEEAWDFFKKIALLSNESELNDVAKNVAKECKGLPIMLATVGEALRNKSSDEWKEALQKLKDARLMEILDVGDDNKNAYNSLRKSYDYLIHSEETQTQILFLLCSLFPEDYEIETDDLTRCAFGMDLFRRVKSMEDVRRKVRVIIDFLRDSSLLLEVDNLKPGDHKSPKAYREQLHKSPKGFKMHGVVRNVALWIGGKEIPERRVFTVRDDIDLKDLTTNKSFPVCRAISFMPNSISELPNHEIKFPNQLETMFIFGGRSEGGYNVNLPEDFFAHLKELKVLDLRGFQELGRSVYFSVPQSLKELTNLRALSLRFCQCSDGSILVGLRNVEALSLEHSKIDFEVEKLSDLTKLRLLDVTYIEIKGKLLSKYYSKSSKWKESNYYRQFSKLEEFYTIGNYRSKCS